jgi:hypothetical protein
MDGYIYKLVQKHILKDTKVFQECGEEDHLLLVEIASETPGSEYL